MINILPYRQKKMVARFRLMRLLAAIFAAITILILIAGALLLPTLLSINTQYALSNNQIQTLEQKGVVTNPVDVAELQGRIKTLVAKLTAAGGVSPTEYVATVRGIVPSGITLTGFTLANNTDKAALSVKGIASTREVLQQFVATLAKTEGIASVDSPISNYVKHTNNDFLLTITFK